MDGNRMNPSWLTRLGDRLRTPPWLMLLTCLGLVQLGASVWRFDAPNNDAVQYYVGARSLLQTGDPYAVSAGQMGLVAQHWSYCYPPLMAYLWLPLALLPVEVASWVWMIFNILLTLVLAWQLADLAGDSSPRSILFLAALLALYAPHPRGMLIGQCHVLLAVLLAGSVQALRRDRDVLAGLLLALAVLLKLFPGLLIVVWWCWGRRRAALIAAAGVLLFTLATWGQTLNYYERFVASGFYPVAAAFNVSLHGFSSRLFQSSDYAIPVTESLLLFRGLLLVLHIMLGILLVCWWRRRPTLEQAQAVGLSLMLLVQPVAGYYHLNLLLLAAVLLPAPAPAGHPWKNALLLAAFLLSALPIDYGLPDFTDERARQLWLFLHTGWGTLLQSAQFYGLVLFFLVSLAWPPAADWQQRNAPAPAGPG
jgi:hypothetical protein